MTLDLLHVLSNKEVFFACFIAACGNPDTLKSMFVFSRCVNKQMDCPLFTCLQVLTIGFLILVGFVGRLHYLQSHRYPILVSNYFWRVFLEAVEVTQILPRIWWWDVLCVTVTKAIAVVKRGRSARRTGCEDKGAVSREFSNCWTAHKAAIAVTSSAFREKCKKRVTRETFCLEARKSLQRTYDVKRKACETQEKLLFHTDGTRRFSNQHMPGHKGWWTMPLAHRGQAVRVAAQPAHSLSCQGM